MNKLFLTVFLCVIALFAGSCSNEKTAPALKVGAIQWLGYEPFFLARSMDKYAPDMVKLVELQSSTDTLRLLREGVLDAGMLTMDEVLGELALGTALKVVLVVDISNGADVLLGKPGLDKLPDLKGKRIGVENNAVGAVLLNGALKKAGLDVSEITLVPLTSDEHLSSYMNGRVDAIVTFKPMSNTLLAQGAVKLFDSSEMPDQIIDVVAVRQDSLAEAAANIEMLIEGYFSALSYLNQFPKKATDMMSPRLGISGQEMLASYDGVLMADRELNRRLLSGSPSRLAGITITLQKTLLEAGLLDHEVSIETLFATQFILGKAAE